MLASSLSAIHAAAASPDPKRYPVARAVTTPHPPGIDRLTPTRRPAGRPVAHQSWSLLTFLHWPVPVELLAPLVPRCLTLDTFAGQAFVGVVPFTMTRVQPGWLPFPLAFHETNVRTYVHRDGRDPGVWFFSLDAANALAVAAARSAWGLPYHYARMSVARGVDGVVEYTSVRRTLGRRAGARCSVRTRPLGAPAPAAADSLEHFLLERYYMYVYAPGRGGRPGELWRGQVHHTPYPAQRAEVELSEESLCAAAGIARTSDAPLAHFASGVDVEIFPLARLAL
jgi:uncharacterized protein